MKKKINLMSLLEKRDSCIEWNQVLINFAEKLNRLKLSGDS